MSAAARTELERQIEEAMVEGFPPRLTEHPYTVEVGWAARLGVGLDVHGALVIAQVSDCAILTLRVKEPAVAWSWRSLIEGLFDIGQLPHNAVVISIEQLDHVKFAPADDPQHPMWRPDMFVRYLEPLPASRRR